MGGVQAWAQGRARRKVVLGNCIPAACLGGRQWWPRCPSSGLSPSRCPFSGDCTVVPASPAPASLQGCWEVGFRIGFFLSSSLLSFLEKAQLCHLKKIIINL